MTSIIIKVPGKQGPQGIPGEASAEFIAGVAAAAASAATATTQAGIATTQAAAALESKNAADADAIATAADRLSAATSASDTAGALVSVSAALLPVTYRRGVAIGKYHFIWGDKNSANIFGYVDDGGRFVVQDLYAIGTASGPAFDAVLWRSATSVTIATGYLEFDFPPFQTMIPNERYKIRSRATGFYVEGWLVWYQAGRIGIYVDQVFGSGTLADWDVSHVHHVTTLKVSAIPTSDMGVSGQDAYNIETGITYKRIASGWKAVTSGPYIPTGDIVVSDSASAASGIALGNDTTGTGTASAPYLTLAKALTVATSGQRIWLNGKPSSPSVYTNATTYAPTVGLTIEAILPLGASIKNSSTTSVMTPVYSGGETLTFRHVIIDGNSVSADCYRIADSAAAHTLNFEGCRLQGFTSHGIFGSGSSTKVNLNLFDTDIYGTGTACADGVYIPSFAAGSYKSIRGSVVLTNQASSGHGPVNLVATASGVTSTAIGTEVSSTLLSSLTGAANHYGFAAIDLAPVNVLGCKVTVTGAYGTRSGVPVYITASARICAGNRVAGNAIYNGTTGGYLIRYGEEDGTAAANDKLNGAEIYCNWLEGIGSVAGQTGALHGILNGSKADANIYRNVFKTTGYAIADKYGSGNWYSNVIYDYYNSAITFKGSISAKARFNTVYQNVIAAQFIQLSTNTTTSTDIVTCELTGNDCVTTMAASLSIELQSGQTSVTFGYNNYALSGSSAYWGNNRFNYNAVTYLHGAAAWISAYEVTGLSCDPYFRDAANRDFRLAGPSKKRAIVPYSATAPVDFYGRARSAGGTTVGAFEA